MTLLGSMTPPNLFHMGRLMEETGLPFPPKANLHNPYMIASGLSNRKYYWLLCLGKRGAEKEKPWMTLERVFLELLILRNGPVSQGKIITISALDLSTFLNAKFSF